MRLTALLAFLLVSLAIAGTAAAYTVTMNFAIRIGSNANNTNATIRVNDTTYSALIANSSVVLLMHLDNSTLDSSLYGNNVSINGTDCSSSVTGRVNGACSFDGIDDYINTSSFKQIDGAPNASFAFWINQKSTPGPGGCNSGACDVVIAAGTNFVFAMGIHSTLAIEVSRGTGSSWGSPAHTLSDNTLTGLNEWNHVVVVINGTTDLVYINGVLGSQKNQDESTFATFNGLIIGNFPGGTLYTNGTIDEVIIYNRTLSAAEVYNLYTSGLSEPTSLTFTNLNKKYISSSQGNATAAFVSAGRLLNARMNNTYNSTHYLFQMTQDSSDNRFLIAATNGTYLDVEDKLSMIDTVRMVSSTFGRFALNVPASFPLFVRLEYTSIDLYGRVFWSDRGQLRMRNSGLTGRNIPNITLEVVRR